MRSNQAAPRRLWSWLGVAPLLVATLLAACSENVTDLPPQADLQPATPIACSVQEAGATSGTIGLLGGTLNVLGSTLSLPLGALLNPTSFTLTLPAAPRAEIDITANGQHNFLFNLPVVVTVSYAHCPRPFLDLVPLKVWYWDASTGTMLENMGGIDNKLLKTVTFTTTHLSGYVIAN